VNEHADDELGDIEPARRALSEIFNEHPGTRAELEARYGQVWNAKQFLADFDTLSNLDPTVVVRRRRDGIVGSLFFQHQPLLFFQFQAHIQTTRD
jgi:hypothetical protein